MLFMPHRKYEQKVTEAPSSITIITDEEIQKYGYRNLLQILNSVPGFYASYDRDYGYIGVRGFGRPGDYNSRILMLVNGHRVNENISDSLGLLNDFYLDVDLIKKIEIVRGPGSALYGSNALFAVINVITKDGADYKGLEIAGEVASHDTEKGRLTYGNTFENGLDLLISGTYFDSNGDRLYYREFDDPSTNNGKVKNDDDHAKNFMVKASLSDFTLTAAHVQREKGVPTAPWGTEFGDRRTRDWDDMTLVALGYQHDFEDDLSITGKLSYHHYNYRGHYVYDDGGLYVNEDAWAGRWWVGELQLTKKLSEQHRFTVGSESQYNVRQDQKNWDSDVYLDDHESSKSWGIYVQDEFKIQDNLTLIGGLRKDYYDATGGSYNPRFALIYKHAEDTIFKFLYGKAFRAPSVYELYYQDGGWTTKANPNLKPETIQTYEFIVEKYFNENIRGSVSAFYYKMDDLIDQTVDSGDGMIMFDNLSQVTAKGLEVALDGKWDNGMQGKASYSYVRTLDKTTRQTLANSPRHLVNFNLIYPLIEKKLFAGIESKYTSKRKTLSNNHAEDAIVTNLTLTYENITKGMDVQVGIYNLFDEKHGHPGFAEHTQDVIEQDGRTVGVKLTCRY